MSNLNRRVRDLLLRDEPIFFRQREEQVVSSQHHAPGMCLSFLGCCIINGIMLVFCLFVTLHECFDARTLVLTGVRATCRLRRSYHLDRNQI